MFKNNKLFKNKKWHTKGETNDRQATSIVSGEKIPSGQGYKLVNPQSYGFVTMDELELLQAHNGVDYKEYKHGFTFTMFIKTTDKGIGQASLIKLGITDGNIHHTTHTLNRVKGLKQIPIKYYEIVITSPTEQRTLHGTTITYDNLYQSIKDTASDMGLNTL